MFFFGASGAFLLVYRPLVTPLRERTFNPSDYFRLPLQPSILIHDLVHEATTYDAHEYKSVENLLSLNALTVQ